MLRDFSISPALLIAGVACCSFSSLSHAHPGFIENRGQIDSRVLYYCSASGADVYLTKKALVMDLREEKVENGLAAEATPDPDRYRPAGTTARREEESIRQCGCAIWVWFEGADPSLMIEAREELPGTYNFFLGNEPEEWCTEIPAYGEIVYRNLWPGVDLAWHSDGGELSFDVRFRPGGDPSAVLFLLEGAEEVEQHMDGSFILETPQGNVVCKLAGEDDITARFARIDRECREGIGSDARDNPSALLWSTFIGGTHYDSPGGMCLDSTGNIILTGSSNSSFFPTTPGCYDRVFNGLYDVFVTKLDTLGSTLLWSTYMGSSDSEYGAKVSLDTLGNPVVLGYTRSSSFPTTPGAYDDSLNGETDLFLAKLGSDGSSLLWSTYLGGSDSEYSDDLLLDEMGNPLVVGESTSSDFPVTPGAYDQSRSGFIDVFVLKLDEGGGSLLWSTYLGGSAWEEAASVSLDSLERPVVSGFTGSPDFPTTPGAYDRSQNGYRDAFVSKLDARGRFLYGSTFLGGSDADYGPCLLIDPRGMIVLAGRTLSASFPTTPGAYDESWNGEYDAFVAMMLIPEIPHAGIPIPND